MSILSATSAHLSTGAQRDNVSLSAPGLHTMSQEMTVLSSKSNKNQSDLGSLGGQSTHPKKALHVLYSTNILASVTILSCLTFMALFIRLLAQVAFGATALFMSLHMQILILLTLMIVTIILIVATYFSYHYNTPRETVTPSTPN